MPEIGTSGSMSGDGKRSVGHTAQATAPILNSTLSDIRHRRRLKPRLCSVPLRARGSSSSALPTLIGTLGGRGSLLLPIGADIRASLRSASSGDAKRFISPRPIFASFKKTAGRARVRRQIRGGRNEHNCYPYSG